MKVLITDACYVSSDKIFSVFFIRGRNIYYKQRGIDVTVLDFSAKEDLIIDDIPVLCLKSYEAKYAEEKFDILVCHAPNIRNHYLFLKRYSHRFEKIVFFFHGHEVLRTSKVYPRSYSYVKESAWYKKTFREVYDIIKLRLWHTYFSKLAMKSHFVYVSSWMLNEFLRWTKINPSVLENRTSITYNTVGDLFEKNTYEKVNDIKYDFITIRGNIDGSKYCIDIVTEIAKQYPQYRFCIVGKGSFFEFNQMPNNITWIDQHLNHDEVIGFLNVSSCALMPTRTDAQGLMACEMATYGIPVITSDIPVCHEIFDEFKNVGFIDNENFLSNFEKTYRKLISAVPYEKNTKYYAQNTCEKEVQLFRDIIKLD